MEYEIAHPDARYTPPRFAAAPDAGYLHVAASVAPPGRVPFVRRHAARDALLAQLAALEAEITRLPEVTQVSAFRAILLPPARTGHLARYDVVMLIQTRGVNDLQAVRAAAPVERMLGAIGEVARQMHVMAARCVRFLGPVDHSRQGLFLFNHFTGANTAAAIGVWEHLAAWYAAETGLGNSTLLAPTGASEFVLVNHARWEIGPLRLALAQLSTPTFRSYVQANLRDHDLHAMPVLYRLVWPPPTPTPKRAHR